MTTSTSSIDLSYNLVAPTATVSSTPADFVTTFVVSFGQYTQVNDIVELEITLTSDTDYSNSEAVQIAVLDAAGISNGILDWVGEPFLSNGDYKGRIRARRSNVNTDWSDIPTWTVSANYGADVAAPVLSTPVLTVTADTTATFTFNTDEGNGTFYYVVSSYSRVPTAAQIVLGKAVDSDGVEIAPLQAHTQAVSGTGEQTVYITSLVKGTTNYLHGVHLDSAGNPSNNISTSATQTDSTPPVVTSVAISALTSTTASGQFSTSQPYGNYYWVVVTGSAPSVTQVKNGQNGSGGSVGAGMKGGPTAVASAGTYVISATNLTANTSGYKLYVVHTDELTQDSAVGASVAFDTPVAVDVTAPVLTSPTLTGTSDTTANLSVVTDEANGTYYWVVTTSSTKPTADQIRSGQNHLGAAAIDSGSAVVASTGIKTDSASGLSPLTQYWAHFTQRDAANNDATVVSSDSITTIATPSNGPLGDTIETYFIGFTNSATPEFLTILNSVAADDVLRLSWSGHTTGFKDKTITAAMLDPASADFLQFTWNDGTLPTFAYGTYAFTIRQTRGVYSITGPTMNVTLAASGGSSSGGGSGGTIENPPPPAAETYYYLTESNNVIVREDGVSYYLRESSP